VDTVYSLEYTVNRKVEMRASLHVRLLLWWRWWLHTNANIMTSYT